MFHTCANFIPSRPRIVNTILNYFLEADVSNVFDTLGVYVEEKLLTYVIVWKITAQGYCKIKE